MSDDRYRTNFAWDSPYGHAVKLITETAVAPGVVLDLGCGWGQVAEPLSALGFKYFGVDLRSQAVEDLRTRGFDGLVGDLTRLSELGETLVDRFAGDHVALVLMLDVLEHIPDTGHFLRSLRAVMESLGSPLLLLSVPNVGHFDIAAKLVLGRFDYTPTGLLDRTHVSLFTEQRLESELRGNGWIQVGRKDFSLERSDQHFPPDHPALSESTALSRWLEQLRHQADDWGKVNQFVRLYTLCRLDESAEPAPVSGPFLSVLVRTTGQRMEALEDALLCLAAQTDPDFEVKLLVHGPEERAAAVKVLMRSFHSSFRNRVEVIMVQGKQRGRPLNEGLDRSTGRYVAFLDDDDLVTGHWVETFRGGASNAPGTIVRSVTLNQRVSDAPGSRLPYVTRSGLEHGFDPVFDLATHLHRNQSPICSFAVPRETVEALNLRFDESLPVTEDWEFFLRAAQVAGVTDTGQPTSIYRRWQHAGGSESTVPPEVWDGVRHTILHRLDQAPLLLPPGSASSLARQIALAATVPGQLAELTDQRAEIDRLGRVMLQAELTRGHLEREVARLEKEIDDLRSSKSFRLTFPIRWFLHHTRRAAHLFRGRS